jgi:AraC-like DNA-binding protein
MIQSQFQVSDVLKPYVKSYWAFTMNQGLENEIIFPSGSVDLVINISNGEVITVINDQSIDMPEMEVFGQLTKPCRITATIGTTVLIARFYPFSSSLFFPGPISDFSNNSIDLNYIFAGKLNEFYDDLMEINEIEKKVNLLDAYLVHQLRTREKTFKKIQLIKQICNCIDIEGESFNISRVSDKYGLSVRYIQKLFLDKVGLTPGKFYSVQRFNKSLDLIRSSDSSLTAIAYHCGYYDQAHFIKEFKRFTGIAPSKFKSLVTIS